MKKITLVLTLVGLIGCRSRDAERTGFEGKELPSFRLLLIDSTTYFNTSSIPPGKPISLFFFGPHCPYSRAQMEEIITHMNSLKNIRFYIFTPYPFPEMKDFYNYYQLYKYSNITVGVDYTNFFGHYFRAKGVPYMAIYGKDKRLKDAFIGEVYGKQIQEIADE